MGAFDDPRVRLVFDDGRRFVEQSEDRYDVVIIDVVDMLDNGPAQSLYTRQFYELLRGRLRSGGIVVVQGLEFSFLDEKAHPALARTLRTVFPEVHSYRVHVPSFLSCWGFLIASDWFNPAQWSADEIDRAVMAKLGGMWLDHLTGEYFAQLLLLLQGNAIHPIAAGTDPRRWSSLRSSSGYRRHRASDCSVSHPAWRMKPRDHHSSTRMEF